LAQLPSKYSDLGIFFFDVRSRSRQYPALNHKLFSAKLDEMKPIVKILHFDEQRTNQMFGHAKYQNDKHVDLKTVRTDLSKLGADFPLFKVHATPRKSLVT
jgi:hypothetical protein